MTIQGGIEQPARRLKVACLGEMPTDEGLKSFINRRLQIEDTTLSDLKNTSYLTAVTAVICTPDPSKPGQLFKQLVDFAETLLDHGCLLFIRIPKSENINFWDFVLESFSKNEWLKALPIGQLSLEIVNKYQLVNSNPLELSPRTPPFIRIADKSMGWEDIAQEVIESPADHLSAPGPNIDPNVSLNITEKLLIQRAFWDCCEVHLEPLDDGKSSARVFIAHLNLMPKNIMTIKNMALEVPRFIKIDSRQKILREYTLYLQKVEPYIPFTLGPNLDKKRCCLGATSGILVGDFVEESESLIACAKENRAVSAISCLFNKTLNNWHHAAYDDKKNLSKYFTIPSLKGAERRIMIAANLGATLKPEDLRNLYKQSDSESPVLVGPTHRDLHGKNVRVRETESILIDFFAYRDNWPIIYDAAFLEASLFIDGFHDTSIDPRALLDALVPLYKVNFAQCDNYTRPKSPSDKTLWFYNAVKQIRLQAMLMGSKRLYAAALSVAFLKKMEKDIDLSKISKTEDLIRAAAYVIAEMILSNTFTK